ncbi:hypothetical protein Ancab_020423 [Ancistrocladus abbreviatus]
MMDGVDDENAKIEGVEEGEISDPDSIKDVSNDDCKFSKQSKPTRSSSPSSPTTITMVTSTCTATTAAVSSTNTDRYWMRDLYKYSYPRGYAASGLYNLAWAQAVQNKPLNEVLVELKPDENLIRSHGHDGEEKNTAISLTGKDDTTAIDDTSMSVVVDSEKEEGELEEGEIDLDSEPLEVEDKESASGGLGSAAFDIEMEDGELEKRVDSIRGFMENVTPIVVEKSFDVVCNHLRLSLESLKHLVSHCWFPTKDALIQKSFAAVQCVISVFCSMSGMEREQNKSTLSRLLTYVLSLNTALFSPQQMKEVEAVKLSISSRAVPPRIKTVDKQEELPVSDKAILTDSNTLAVNSGHNLSSRGNLEADSSVGAFDKKCTNLLSDSFIPLRSSNIMARAGISPLLDPHKVHDEDSLPSPTRKMPLPFLVTPPLPVGDVTIESNLAASGVVSEAENIAVHPYETDALKAVSSYQQKFGRTTFLSNDRLPSPTPSEEFKDGEAEDAGDEVSSYSMSDKIKALTPPVLSQTVVFSAPMVNSSQVTGMVTGSSAGLLGPGNPTFRATSKSRDPRLRYINPDLGAFDLNNCTSPVLSAPGSKLELSGELTGLKKHKIAEVPSVDGPAVKKQRNGLETSEISVDKKQVLSLPGSKALDNGGIVGPDFVNRSQLGTMAIDPRKSETVVVCSGAGTVNPSMAVGASSQPAVSGSTSASLHSLLSNITVNPSAWINIFREQKQSSDSAKSLLHPVDSIFGAVSLSNVTPPSSSGSGQKTARLAQDESAKIRMKPRDPRRVLHTGTTQKGGSSGLEHLKTTESPMAISQGVKENSNSPKHVNGTDKNAALSQPSILPDIAKQFTESLKNIADIISVSPTSVVPSISPQSASQQVQVTLDDGRPSGPLSASNQRTGPGLKPEEGAGPAGPAQSQSNWGDVEHLFEGYDDQQKAAIQRERARRIEEQKKMFADRKLCLVLDLDHTLLNSAKFSEVEPVHDEMLRKKEEQDREKLQRHLFRFPHMGMWTKLRPGIWNFLEKASKLYELHLYTMGNKLYATEMAKVLDPKGVLFAGRVISRGDDGDIFDGDERVPKSKDLDGVLGMESAVVIIDDSVRVWPHNKLNLIVVERYTYFPCSRRQFGLPGPSLLEIDHDERPEDGTLASSLAVIERIHQNFFSNQSLDDVDVRNILASEQRKILSGCRIVFSRVFPVGEANPHLHPLWQTAEQFGAICTNQIDEQVTHVVANSLGTDKVNWALSTGRHVVHPGWVEASALLYRRANEQDFAIKS